MIEQIKEHAEGLFNRAILFGSTVRGESREKSDIDMEFRLKLYDVTNNIMEFDILAYGRNELKSIRKVYIVYFESALTKIRES